MASFSKRGDQSLTQVRVTRAGVVEFSQSQVFADGNEALIRMHLKYQRNLRSLGRSTSENHDCSICET